MSKRPLRVLQLIDSLRAGGAERIAVSYANALNRKIEASYLCCTRMEGLLKEDLSPEVGYLFLEKKNSLDSKALFRLRTYIKKHKIDLIQAHSTSWFLALLVKSSVPGVKLVWHDHYGRELKTRKPGILRFASRYFDCILSVNFALKDWAEKNLFCPQVQYVRNFLPADVNKTEDALTSSVAVAPKLQLQGNRNAFKIVCVANLRSQKDHLNLLKAFEIILEKHPGTTLHLIGKDEQDDYSAEIKNYLRNRVLEGVVFIYGEQTGVRSLIKQADLAVLSSASEGLPVAILEYGACGLPVVCTEVGECATVLSYHGKVVPPGQALALASAMEYYMEHPEERKKDASAFHRKVENGYAEAAILPEIMHLFEKTCKKRQY